MEMHQLRYALAIAQTGNFSRAAEQCNVSQPSLSQQIQKLEGELGERLFDRLKRGARPTPQGIAFLRRAERILDEADIAKREILDAHHLLCGALTIGMLPTIAPYLLPYALKHFTHQFPGVEIIICEETTGQLVKQLINCEIDLAILSLPIRDERLEIMELHQEELWLALPPSHTLTRKRQVNATDLSNEPLIVLTEAHCLGDQVLGFCDQHDLSTQIRFRSAQLETIQALVCAGLGISLIPAMAIHANRPHAPHYRRLAPPRPSRKIVAVWHRQRGLGRASAKFLETLALMFRRPNRQGD